MAPSSKGGPREAARSRLQSLSLLGSAGSVAVAGLVAGAAAQAYATRATAPPPTLASTPAPDPGRVGALSDRELLGVEFSLVTPPPEVIVVHRQAAAARAVPGQPPPVRGVTPPSFHAAPAAAPGAAPIIAAAPPPRPAPRPTAAPPAATTGQS